MAGSGIGRGRGWLNINKNQNFKPGSSPNMNVINTETSDLEANTTVVSVSKIDPKYSNIISKINLYDEHDDGIKLNQKLKYIIEELTNTCQTNAEVCECFESMYEHCLSDLEYASKLIGISTTLNFRNLVIHDVRYRAALITNFQKNFKNCKQLQANNPAQFRIVVQMLGEYFHKGRMCDGSPIKVLAEPLMQYFTMLLESNNEADFELFTMQLFLNGNELKDLCTKKHTLLLLQLRTVLTHNEKLSSVSKLWLTLALDLANSRYSLLPTILHQFYVTKLGDKAMSQIKKLDTLLSVQVAVNNIDVQENTDKQPKCDVDVLKKVQNWDVQTPKKPPRFTINNTSDRRFMDKHNGAKLQSNNASEQNYKIYNWDLPKEKTPRPILGVGARLKHEEKNSETSEWNETPTMWDTKKKIDGNLGNNSKKSSKGWEHDDRVENDYN